MLVARLILILLLIPFFTHAAVVINEIAWMGTANSSSDEWMELYNNDNENVDLSGWILYTEDGTPSINLSGSISGSGFFLLERTDNNSVPNVIADLIYTGALSNTGETLILKNQNGIEIDKFIGGENWSNIGDNITKQTAQRTPNGGWITADSTPRAQNSGEQQSSQTTTVIDSLSWPVEPQIYANAGPDKTAVAGADVIFSGQALGLNKEPLENARYLWSFGDGAMAEGKSVKHIYKYPSEYIAVLDISSGEYSASDIALVKVIPNQLIISEANKDFIKLQNDSNVTLDISGWFLRSNNITFRFPETTLIKAKASLPITSEITKIEINKNIEILYPNGSLAYSYSISISTTVVEPNKPTETKKPEVKTETFNLPVSTSTDSTDQVASVAGVFTDEQNNQGGIKKWLLIILGLGIFSAAGFIFIRRH